jgi:hypothetical protein
LLRDLTDNSIHFDRNLRLDKAIDSSFDALLKVFWKKLHQVTRLDVNRFGNRLVGGIYGPPLDLFGFHQQKEVELFNSYPMACA